MIVRAEQMQVFQAAAEDDFISRLGRHLRENYGSSIVRLPDRESAVADLPQDELQSLVGHGIERARSYEMTFESSISAFTAVMFDVAPNFDRHSMSRLCLKDESVDPNDRLDEVLKLLTKDHWEKIRNDYDVNAWLPEAKPTEETETGEAAESTETPDLAATAANFESPAKTPAPASGGDFAATVMNAETAQPPGSPEGKVPVEFAPAGDKPRRTVNLDDINFDETMLGAGRVKKGVSKDEDIDLDATIMNFDEG